MAKLLARNSEPFLAIQKYLKDSLGFETYTVLYVGTLSDSGLTPIVRYTIKASLIEGTITFLEATVYWNNATEPPTITRMDVV